MAEEQQIAVSVLNFKSSQSILTFTEGKEELGTAGREFRRECLWIWDMNEGVPAGDAFLDIPRVIRHRFDTDVFQDDRRPTSLDNAEEDVVLAGPLKRDVETETIAIKRQCGWDTLYDEEWCDAGYFRFSHVN